MAIRFAPFAKIKVFSLASYLYRFVKNNNDSEAVSADVVSGFIDLIGTSGAGVGVPGGIGPSPTNGSMLSDVKSFNLKNLGALFDDVALATSVSITETFNTKPIYGIGAPESPIIVPGNVSVRVSMARLTTDARQIADYVTKPTFYYSAALQKLSTKKFASIAGNTGDLDMLFYTYFFLDSLETETFKSEIGQLQNFEIVAFMPNTYNKRIESNAAEIVTDVEGEGKLFRLKDFVEKLNSVVAALAADPADSDFTLSSLP